MFVSNTDDPIYTFLFHTGFHSHGLISCVLLNPIKHKVLYNEFFVKITHVWICAVMKISMSVIQNFSAQQSSMVMFPRTKRWPNTMQSDYYISRFINIYIYVYIYLTKLFFMMQDCGQPGFTLNERKRFSNILKEYAKTISRLLRFFSH